MDECKICANADNEYCFTCDNGNQFKPITNADRIRAMSDEELAKWITIVQGDSWIMGYAGLLSVKYPNNEEVWLDWLREEGET